jgi:hypothetical protein
MLVERCPLVLMVGASVDSRNDVHVRAANLPPNHPLTGMFCLAALSPTLSLAIATRPDPHKDGTVDIVVTHDAGVCRQVVRHVIETLDTLEGGVRHGTRPGH